MADKQSSDRARRQARLAAVGAAGQHDRYPGAEHNTSTRRVADLFELLGQHVACLQIRHNQHIGTCGDRRPSFKEGSGGAGSRVNARCFNIPLNGANCARCKASGRLWASVMGVFRRMGMGESTVRMSIYFSITNGARRNGNGRQGARLCGTHSGVQAVGRGGIGCRKLARSLPSETINATGCVSNSTLQQRYSLIVCDGKVRR